MNRRWVAGVMALAFGGVAACAGAEIFRCRAAGGAVTYQQIPCPDADGRVLDIPSAYPDTNYAERDRLLRREAELDARLLKRAEIDAAVRIAREERQAREAELRREEQMRRAAAADAPLLIVVPRAQPMRRAPRHAPRWL